MKRLALALAVIASLIIPVASVTATAVHNPHKVYVCKYVGKPGVNERLQTGRNPIEVDRHAVAGDPEYPDDVVGITFNDAQTHSIVIGWVGTDDVPLPVLDIEDCPAPAQDEPTPTPTPTATPTEEVTTQAPTPTPSQETATPTEEVTTNPPTETPTEEVTTQPATETPTTETGTPPVEIDRFSIDVCPDLAAIIRGDQSDTVIEAVPAGKSAIRIRAVGAILLIALHVRIDGQLVVPDGDGVLIVSPGTHTLSISDPTDTTVLAEGDVDCPVCDAAANPTPKPPAKTLPPTDTLSADRPDSGSGSLTLVMLVLAGITGASLLVTSKRR